jgi:hypothetical protein
MSIVENHTPALEAIDFQDGALYRALTNIFVPFAMKGSLPANKDLTAICGDVENIIQKYVGFKPEVMFEYHPTMVVVPVIDRSSVLVQSENSRVGGSHGLDMIRKSKKGLTSDIDLKKSRVGGDFAKISPLIVLDLAHFVMDKFTAEEFAAVILHEVGHVFTMYEFLDRTVQTNQVLAGLDRELRGTPDDKKRKLVIEEAGKTLNFDRTVITAAIEATQPTAVSTIFLSESFKQMKSENGHSFYDINSWEMLADQFAARHGASRAVITGLKKMYRRTGESTGRSAVAYYILEILKIAGAVLVGASAAGLTVLGVTTANLSTFFAGLSLLPVFFGMIIDDDDGTYDKPIDRAMRLRRQLIELSRMATGDKKLVDQITKDVEMIDEATKDYNNRQTWFQAIAAFVSSNSRRKQDVARFQKELEALANNDLFLKSAQLSTLGV